MKKKRKPGPNPSGLCKCGCGQQTPIAKHYTTKRGLVKGEPANYMRGHGNRGKSKIAHLTEKACRQCGVVKPLDAFWRASYKPGGHDARCIECKSNEEERAKHREASRRWRERYPDKVKAAEQRRMAMRPDAVAAKSQVGIALKSGRLVRPDSCEVCGSPQNLQAHHPDYSQPLDVRWLCALCHNRLHAAQRRLDETNPRTDADAIDRRGVETGQSAKNTSERVT